MEPAATPRPARVGPLAYAPAPPFHRRRWWRGTVLLAALLIAGGAAWRWGPEKWSAARMLYAQRQCLAYAPPADEVVYEADPAAAARLASRAGFRLVAVPAFSGSGPPAVAAARTPVPSGATVFLHERLTPDGGRVLVHVGFVTDPSGVAMFIPGYDATVDVFEPGTWSAPPTERGRRLRDRRDERSAASPAPRAGIRRSGRRHRPDEVHDPIPDVGPGGRRRRAGREGRVRDAYPARAAGAPG
jgi:hypothetical protein